MLCLEHATYVVCCRARMVPQQARRAASKSLTHHSVGAAPPSRRCAWNDTTNVVRPNAPLV
jgi:hypothetical protein